MYKFAPNTKSLDKLLAARVAMKEILPLIYPISLKFSWVQTNSIPTSAVDAEANFYYNDNFIKNCDTLQEVMNVVAHECMHIVQKYHARVPKLPDLDQSTCNLLFNLAADRVINSLLWEHHKMFQYNKIMDIMGVNIALVNEVIKNYRYTEALFLDLLKAYKRGKSSENNVGNSPGNGSNSKNSIGNDRDNNSNSNNDQSGNADSYGDVIKNVLKGLNPGPIKDSLDGSKGFECQAHKHHGKHEEEIKTDEEAYDKWRMAVEAGKDMQKSRGDNNSSMVKELLNKLFAPKISWKDILVQYLDKTFGFKEYTYYKRARRSISDDLIFPGVEPPLGRVAVAIDMSGSMTKEERELALSETYAICKSYVSSVLAIMHTSDVYFAGELQKPEDVHALPWATGGTSHIEVFDVIENKHPKFKANLEADVIQLLVCFTDMETVFPDKEPSIPVLWVDTTNRKHDAPFGTVMSFKQL